MQRAVFLALLWLAVAAFAESLPATDLFAPPVPAQPGQYTQYIEALHCRQNGMTVPGAVTEGRHVYEVCGNTLRRLDRDDSRHANLAMSYSGATSTAPRMPVWKQAGVYGLEFTVAAVGTLIAEAGGLATIEGVYQAGWNGPGSVPGATAYCVTSALLTATGTHLMGKLVRRGNSFSRALAGGAVGGLLGGAAFIDYFVTRKNPHSAMMPIAFVLPPLCAVVAYNVWRSDGTK